MDLPDLKQLNKIIALCRKQGVDSIEIGNVKLTLGEPKAKTLKSTKKTLGPISDPIKDEPIKTDGWDSFTDEEKLFWSIGSPLGAEPKGST